MIATSTTNKMTTPRFFRLLIVCLLLVGTSAAAQDRPLSTVEARPPALIPASEADQHLIRESPNLPAAREGSQD